MRAVIRTFAELKLVTGYLCTRLWPRCLRKVAGRLSCGSLRRADSLRTLRIDSRRSTKIAGKNQKIFDDSEEGILAEIGVQSAFIEPCNRLARTLSDRPGADQEF